ncbi:hypothetical protein KBB85_03375 [Patescibacteria group bacterium]|nr:hypothetical protein [Patescibacteria group bacterium]
MAAQAQKKQQRYIILRKNQPTFELRPFSEKDPTFEQLQKDLEMAEEDVRVGRLYTQAEAEKMLGI